MSRILQYRGRLISEDDGVVAAYAPNILYSVEDLEAPTAPTVDTLSTEDLTPTITGTFDSSDYAGGFTVTVAGATYTLGTDPELTNVGDVWTLAITAPIALGTYDVVARACDAYVNCASDATTDELVLYDSTAPTAPTVTSQTASTSTPTITGTYPSSDAAALTVTVNGVTYTLGVDAALTAVGDNWSLVVPATGAMGAGTYDVVAIVTDASSNATADTTLNELTITAQTCASACPTLRSVLNNVLINLGESQLASTTVLLSESYHLLLRNFFNEFLREIQDAHDWTSIRTDCFATVLSGADSAIINDGTSCIPSGARLTRIADVNRGYYLPLVIDVTDASTPGQMHEINLQEVLRRQWTYTGSVSSPRQFAIDTENNAAIIRLAGLPDANVQLELSMYVPQGAFTGDATDLDSCVKLPHNALKALEVGVTWYALEERGEELGTRGLYTEQRYQNALDAAVAQDEENGSGDNHIMVPV